MVSKNWSRLLVVALLATETFTAAFSPSLLARTAIPALSFSNDDDGSENSILQRPVVSPNLSLREEKERQIVVPFHEEMLYETPTPPKTSRIRNACKALLQSFQNQLKALRPSQKFRARLGFATAAAFIATSILRPNLRLASILKNWVATRGFAGLSAFGRSIVYAWGLFVAYPKMLDRRAKDRVKREKERAADQRRQQLTRLAAEVSRLRQELATIDAEIRSFRREIIAMKAYAAKMNETSSANNIEVQEAIGKEMSHLGQLRLQTQAELAAARQAWVDLRSKSPADTWSEDVPMI